MDERPRTPRSQNCGKTENDPMLYKKYFSKYKTIRKLGEGSFGKVYKAEYNGEYYALKFENRNEGQNLLETEATIMSYLKGPNIPLIKSYGYSGEYNVLVMQLMGKSLEDIFNKRLKFSVKTCCMLGYQMINVLNYIHDRHIIHRDIKPDNFVMGFQEYNAYLYLLDFGLAKKFRSSKTLIQYPYVKKKKLTGTARYASIHALEEMEQSRRDDLEAVSYVLMYFLRGNLPWQGLKIKAKEDRYKKILDKKKETTSEELCMGFPEEFKIFVDYSKNLGYTENPNYKMLKDNFVKLVRVKMCENFDYVYDWTTQNDIRIRKNDDDLFPGRNLEEKNNYKGGKQKNSEGDDNNGGIKNITDIDETQKDNNNDELEDKVESKCCIM